MGVGVAVLTALLIGVAAAAVITLSVLSFKKLRELIRERLERRKNQKVLFGSTRKIVNERAKEILDQAPSMTLEELEEIADEQPYFIANYDPVTEESDDFVSIQAESTEQKVEEFLCDNDGIVLFE